MICRNILRGLRLPKAGSREGSDRVMDEKGKRILRIVGAAAGVYLVFKYILPLAAPFVFAAAAAVLLKPPAEKVAGKLRFEWRGRVFGVAPCVIAVTELTLALGVLGAAAYAGGRRLCGQIVLFMERMPEWLAQLNRWLTGMCHLLEERLTLREDTMVYLAQDMIQGLGERMKQGVMPYLMGNSMSLAQGTIGLMVVMILFMMGVMLFVREMDGIRQWMEHSFFREEFIRIGRVLALAGRAYLRAQGIILLFTMALCTAGLFLLKNPYYILAGIGLGLLDALPVFGTGTVLVPWAVVCFFRRRWRRGLFLLALYAACYLLREFLEAKLLSDKVGLSPLLTLISIYVGLQLFGIPGVLLGPVGALVIREFCFNPADSPG